MKRYILIFLFAFIIFPLISFAQYSWQWAIAEGAAYNEYITSIDFVMMKEMYMQLAFLRVLLIFSGKHSFQLVETMFLLHHSMRKVI